MRILFAAQENSWGGFYHLIKAKLPGHNFEATGQFKVESLKGFDVLIPTMCLVTQELLETGDRLKLIQQCGSGLEGVDLFAASAKDIWVANVPTGISGNADSVAELGIYLMIGLSRDVRGMDRSLKNRKMGEPPGISLRGKTVGLIGLGGIGQALVKRLKLFGVRLIGVKRHNPQKACEKLGMEWVGSPQDIMELLKESDYVILCLPLTEDNKGLIDHNAFQTMKKNSFLINLSRGGLVDKTALLEALREKTIAGAGLDVFWEEPPDPDDPVFKYNVLATPHIAGSTDVSIHGIVKVVAENILRIEMGMEPFYQKNIKTHEKRPEFPGHKA